MAYKIKKINNHRERRNFSSIENTYELQDLLEIQKKSYQEFLTNGIDEVFKDLFPIENNSGGIRLDFVSYQFDEPRYTIKEAKYRETTYAAPLKVQARL